MFLGELGKYHAHIFLPQHLWGEEIRAKLFSRGVAEAGHAFGAGRLLPLIHHLLVSRLQTTASSPAVLHAQVPSGRRFLRAARSGETPLGLRGNPTSGLPLSQTFIYLFCAQDLCFISVLLKAEGIHTTEENSFFKAPKMLSLSW